LKPYVFRKISVAALVREAREKLLESLVKSQLNVEGLDIQLCTSTTNWGGKRVWFVCPSCNRRCGKIIETDMGLLCNKCIQSQRT